MNKFLFVAIFLSFIRFDLQAQFSFNNRFTGNTLRDVVFLDQNKGFVVGDSGIIAMSVDAGINWTIIEAARVWRFNEIHFFDSQDGIAISQEKIYLTNDGGFTWFDGQAPTQKIYDFEELNDSVCLITASGNSLLRSSDRGHTWINITDSVTNPYPLGAISFIDEKLGYAYTQTISNLTMTLRTLDSGRTWNNVPDTNTNNVSRCLIKDLEFISDSVGFRTGIYGSDDLFKSTRNNAKYWIDPINDNIATPFYGMFIHPEITSAFYLSGTDNRVFKSIDQGRTWFNLRGSFNPSQLFYDYHAIYFLNDTLGWIVGEYGRVGRTVTGVSAPYISLVKPIGLDNLNFGLYPNPVSDVLFIESNQNIEKIKISVYDLQGKKHKVTLNENTIDVSILPKGVYIVQMRFKDVFETRRVIIQ